VIVGWVVAAIIAVEIAVGMKFSQPGTSTPARLPFQSPGRRAG
jgi:hypothetical protein